MSEVPGVLLVHGDEAILVDRTVGDWRSGIPADTLEILDAPARLEPLMSSLVDVPLFADARFVLVRNLAQLSGARKGSAGVDELTRALAMRSPTTHVCFAVRGTVTPANPVLAAIVAGGGTVVHHPQLRAGERRQWLEGELRRRQLRLPPGGVDVLLRCSGGDLATVAGELDKLVAHGTASVAQLQNLVAGSELLQLYNVLDSLTGGQPARGAALLVELLAEGRSPQYLLSILAGQLRDVLIAHALITRGHTGAASMASALRIPSWRAERVVRTARAVPAVVALAWVRDLQRIDAGLKAGEIDDSAALQRWGLRAARDLAAAAPAGRGRGS